MVFRWLKLIGLGTLSVLLLVQTGFAQLEDGVVAKVANVKITAYELGREMQRILPLNSSYHSAVSKEKVAEIREKSTLNLIEKAYKVQYALENEISVSSAEIEEKLVKVREKFKTDAELQKALKNEKLSEYRASIYRNLLAEKAEDLKINQQVQVADDAVFAFYTENQQMYQRPKRYRVSQILIKVAPTLLKEERVELLVKAEDLAERALGGEDFYNLAYYNSDEAAKYVGGDIGYFHSGQVVKELEDAIKDLKPGDIVGPVETLSGFHVVKLTEVEEPRLMPYEEVKDKIRSMLEGKRRDVLYKEWMTGLKAKYPSEVFTDGNS